MADRSPPPPSDDLPEEDLIAYLDGELDEAESEAVKNRLADDPKRRRDAEALKKSYELLDHLPRPEPSANFTNRTLTHIGMPVSGERPAPERAPVLPTTPSQSAQPISPSQPVMAPPPAHHWSLIRWAFAAVAAAVLGYLGHLLAKPHLDATDPAKRTSEQVRLLERLPLYLGVDDLNFVRQLASPELFGDADGESESAKPSADESMTTSELTKLETLFKTYPLARQTQLQTLDDDFSNLSAAEQKSLFVALERYAIWLDRLPDAYRQEVLQAPAAVERLDKVMLVKSRLWKESLPAAIREKIQTAEEPQREQILADYKQREANRNRIRHLARTEWANIASDRKPWPFDTDELAKRVEDYVDNSLKSRLMPNERSELESLKKEVEIEKRFWGWFVYGSTLLRLSESHPSLPEPASGKMVKTMADLQAQHPTLATQLRKTGPGGVRRLLEKSPAIGRWPDFAEAVLKEANELQVNVRTPLGPCRPDEYTEPVAKFVKEELLPKLSAGEKDDWKKLEGRWPEHSKRMMELARKHDLLVPGVPSLPGSPAKWDSTYRRGLPAKK